MADVRVVFEGWGRGPWGFGPWGEGSYGTFELTTSLGQESVTTGVSVSLTGVQGTTTLGNVVANADGNIDVLGQAATAELGTPSVIANANVFPTGVSAEASTLNNGSEFTADGDAQLSTAQAKFGSASLLLDGTDDFVTSDENIDLSSGDFTVDMWIRPTSVTGYKGLWQSGTSSLLNVYLIGDQVQGTVAGSTTLFLSSTRISANVWTMISVEREGNVHRLYINGVLEASSSTANRSDDGVFAIGKNGFGDFNGYIDEVRLSSVARYEGTSFTEPVAEYEVDRDTTALLHFDGTNGSTDIINETAGNVTVTGDANANVTGVEATAGLGTPSVTTDVNISVTGVAGTSALGTASVVTVTYVFVTGVAANGAVGDVSLELGATVFPTGVEATGQLNTVLVWGNIIPDQTPTWVEVTPSGSDIWTEIAA